MENCHAKKRCAIVGGGLSGLVSTRWALLYGIEPVVFECTDKVGGLWVYKPEETVLSTCMRSTVINTSKEMTAFSDFVPPAEAAPFMHNSHMLKYMQSYAEHYGLLDHVRFNHTVKGIERATDYDESGRWTVRYTDNSGQSHEETFDYVLFCGGHHADPNWPKPWPGQEEFQGRIIHSHSYKHSGGFEEKVNVGVGIGNSGVDVACDLSCVSKQVYLSTRRGAWVFPKLGPHGRPIDMTANTRFGKLLTPYLLKIPGFLERKYRAISNQFFDHDAFGVQPKHSVLAQHPTLSDDLPSRILNGRVKVKPDIKRFTKTGIEWADGTVTEPVDNVVFSTGYKFSFPLIERGKLIPVSDNHVTLWKNMYPPQLAKHNTLAIIGLLQINGSAFPTTEIQARLFFHAAAGGLKLPSGEQMREQCEARQRYLAARFVDSPRHTIEIDYVGYMDEMARLIGCEPNPLEYALSDPTLAYHLMFSPIMPYFYRIRGPHAWRGARDAILDADERVKKGTRTRDPGVEEPSSGAAWYLVAIGFILILFAIVF